MGRKLRLRAGDEQARVIHFLKMPPRNSIKRDPERGDTRRIPSFDHAPSLPKDTR